MIRCPSCQAEPALWVRDNLEGAWVEFLCGSTHQYALHGTLLRTTVACFTDAAPVREELRSAYYKLQRVLEQSPHVVREAFSGRLATLLGAGAKKAVSATALELVRTNGTAPGLIGVPDGAVAGRLVEPDYLEEGDTPCVISESPTFMLLVWRRIIGLDYPGSRQVATLSVTDTTGALLGERFSSEFEAWWAYNGFHKPTPAEMFLPYPSNGYAWNETFRLFNVRIKPTQRLTLSLQYRNKERG